ncbi:LytTR family DNA-binding domain-containing protein [Gillisia sp. M10.2A]|uniref:LytTR family DNA-binding domain-containing protein n=1 Tax=Gillisia lutea TaxID=2909668 RepID=A0ABS9EG07_9FLAO|nr:LytTR family DNA-binding domain-containing protein [Gillisia lutea]MCF4101824.1 LytTR family DNA-binding domain-containing protein [Gillisia lutea]
MNAIIIEDEKPAARRLNRMLDKLEVPIIAVLHSVEDAVNWFIENEHPDIIFLDIQLSDGLSFEIFDKVKIKSAVIFTTAYDEYALQAFKLNSIDYLLKPIDDEELQVAVDKYKELFTNLTPNESNTSLQLNFEDIKKLLVNPVEREYKKRFTVKVGQHLKMIPLEEVECIYSENKGTYVHTSEGRNYLLETTLEGLEDELPPDDFFRVSRKVFIQLAAIKDIIAYSNSRLKIVPNSFKDFEIIVARERVKSFKQWLG